MHRTSVIMCSFLSLSCADAGPERIEAAWMFSALEAVEVYDDEIQQLVTVA